VETFATAPARGSRGRRRLCTAHAPARPLLRAAIVLTPSTLCPSIGR